MRSDQDLISALFARRAEWTSVFQPIINLVNENVVESR